MPDELVQAPAAGIRTEVIREEGFVRLSVDNVLLNFLGRDIEAALLTSTNDIRSLVVAEDGKLADIEGVGRHVEVARVRMSPDAGFTMFQNMCILLLSSGLVSPETIDKAVAAAKDTAQVSSGKEEVSRAH